MIKAYLHSAQHRSYEYLNYLRASLFRKTSQIRFIYFAHSRSGSHLFADLIGAHPDVTCLTEQDLFLRRRAVRRPVAYIDGVSKRFRQSPVFGGKINVRQLNRQNESIHTVVAQLAASNWKFILLKRENTLKQTVSALLAKQRKQYHDTVLPAHKPMQITLDLPLLHQMLRHKTAANQLAHDLLAPYDPLTISYETDLVGAANQQRTANRVFEFLGIEAVPVNTKFVKTGVYALSDYIMNYDEMVQSLDGTEFAQFSHF